MHLVAPLLDSARRWLAAALILVVAGCANSPGGPRDAADADPLEPFNRYMFEVNRFGDEFALKPLAVIYRGTVPSVARESVANAVANLRLPWTAANDVLQGELGRAGTAAARFALNSTFGFLGLFDMARDVGFPHHDEDFGQTLGVWGVTGDPYLVLPLFGPSSPRDAVGTAVDWFLDPVTIVAKGGRIGGAGNVFTYSRTATSVISSREMNIEALAELERGVDYYAAIRSAWRQRREADVRNESTSGRRFVPRFSLD